MKEMNEEELKIYHDNENTLDFYYQKGFKVGLEEARREVILNIARKIKNQGIDKDIISKVTELSIEEIRKL
jgi:predicted transposase/invertase (TIGR01784 family)